MDGESLDSCSICMDPYNDTVRPRCLPCGHNFCSTCLKDSIERGIFTCAHCQETYSTTSVDNLPINYGMEALISEMRKSKLGTTTKQKPANIANFSVKGNKWETIFKDQKDCLRKWIHTIEETQTDLNKYKDFIRQRKLEHAELLSQVFDIVHQNEDIFQKMEAEEKKLEAILKEGDEHCETITLTLSKYDQATNTKDIFETSVEADTCFESISDWKTRINSQLPDTSSIVCSDVLIRDTNAALKGFTLINEAKADILDFSTSSMPVMDKIKRIKGKPTLTLSKLQTTSESIKEALEKGHIYAIRSKDGHIRSAKVIAEDNQIYLHCLRDEEPPAYAHTIQQSELIEALEKASVRTFMDLHWEGSDQGRILISHSPYNALARHFRILCTGDLGPSYLQTRFMTDKEKYYESIEGSWYYEIHGGDYENNDGSGGAPLISGLDPCEIPDDFQRSAAGVVCPRFYHSDGQKIAQFCIRLVDSNWLYWEGDFGFVEKGLELLKLATAVDDINQVKVADCGVVFNLDEINKVHEVTTYDNPKRICVVM